MASPELKQHLPFNMMTETSRLKFAQTNNSGGQFPAQVISPQNDIRFTLSKLESLND
jgi:hypothetical protein